jgi:hypothetical protein
MGKKHTQTQIRPQAAWAPKSPLFCHYIKESKAKKTLRELLEIRKSREENLTSAVAFSVLKSYKYVRHNE